MHTEVGKIGRALQVLEPQETPLHRDTSRLVMISAIAGVILCVLVFLTWGLTRGSWLEGILLGITLAMALIPEEIPVVLTIFLALGAWRLSRRSVLTRSLSAMQAIGSVTVLCVDKTGTLTLNRMSVRRLYADGKFCDVGNTAVPMTEPCHELVEYAVLASQRDAFDPMERALKELGEKLACDRQHIHNDWVLVREYPLSKHLFALSHVWRSAEGCDYVIAAKGAPEAILDLCHISGTDRSKVIEAVQSMAGEGMRVLGVARACIRMQELPADQHGFPFSSTGLVGFEDPVRPGVHNSVKECYDAGIRVIMITGDYPLTAEAIARQAGIRPEGIITGPQLRTMNDQELRQRIRATDIFARVVPEQKLRIVDALKANGEVVLMTGDGVNDAPALKSAHIGIAMGRRGTEVAREASGLVLLDDDFSSIVQAVRTGRRILDNIRKAIAYIFAVHVPIAGMSLLPIALMGPVMLFPAHIAFLELIIDPACSVAFEAEPEEKDVMKRPPRRIDHPVFDRRMIAISLLQGFIVMAVVASMFFGAPLLGRSDGEARAMAFATLVIANLGLILTNRSWSRTFLEMFSVRNEAMIWVVVAAVIFLSISLYVQPFAAIFQFSPPGPGDLAICLGAGILSVAWFEVLKIVKRVLVAIKVIKGV